MANVPGSGPLVLVGCEDARTVAYLTELLESWDFNVEVAERGALALLRLEEQNPPGIALLDMDLAGTSGVEIVWQLSRRQEPPRTWTVLMSREPGKDRVRAALECGCDDFLTLPPDALDLKLRIRVAERVKGLLSQMQRQKAELSFQSTHDGRTGLWNREALLSLIFQETDRVQRMKTDLSLMVMDLDEFSRINHDYGYEAGDGVLTELANRFRRQLRSYDLIGRCGEDEFLLAVPGCRRESSAALAERIRETILARPFAVGSEATTLTASFGIAVSHGRSPLVVLREAERALAEAKLGGKNCVRCAGVPEARMLEGFVAEAVGAGKAGGVESQTQRVL
jgi:diguanylate cyclase (GGDEF)-like protein